MEDIYLFTFLILNIKLRIRINCLAVTLCDDAILDLVSDWCVNKRRSLNIFHFIVIKCFQ